MYEIMCTQRWSAKAYGASHWWHIVNMWAMYEQLSSCPNGSLQWRNMLHMCYVLKVFYTEDISGYARYTVVNTRMMCVNVITLGNEYFANVVVYRSQCLVIQMPVRFAFAIEIEHTHAFAAASTWAGDAVNSIYIDPFIVSRKLSVWICIQCMRDFLLPCYIGIYVFIGYGDIILLPLLKLCIMFHRHICDSCKFTYFLMKWNCIPLYVNHIRTNM
jgi:hypothetical protein